MTGSSNPIPCSMHLPLAALELWMPFPGHQELRVSSLFLAPLISVPAPSGHHLCFQMDRNWEVESKPCPGAVSSLHL